MGRDLFGYRRRGSGRLLLRRLGRLRGLAGHLHATPDPVIGQRLTDTYAIVAYANAIYVALGLCPVGHALYHILFRVARQVAPARQSFGRCDRGGRRQRFVGQPRLGLFRLETGEGGRGRCCRHCSDRRDNGIDHQGRRLCGQ